MTLRALVIDDDPQIVEVISDIVASLGHTSDTATCQDETRQRLATTHYDYFVLDLEIPVRSERSVARLQNGLNLLGELVAARLGPVIVVTGYGNNGPDQGVECVKLGAADYVAKPFKTAGKTLDVAITDALRRAGRLSSTNGQRKSTAPPRPFAGGEIQLLKKRLVVCETEVPITPMMYRILSVLSERTASGKYSAYSGEELAEHENVNCARGQNGVSEAIYTLRKRISSAVLKEAHVEVGDQDIIRSKAQGYRISDTVTVVVGARRLAAVASAENVPDDPVRVPTNGRHVPVGDPDVPDDVPDLNSRQKWIMGQIRRGTQVRVSMVVTQFRCSQKTAKRDLSNLKDKQLVRFVGSPRTGHYVLT